MANREIKLGDRFRVKDIGSICEYFIVENRNKYLVISAPCYVVVASGDSIEELISSVDIEEEEKTVKGLHVKPEKVLFEVSLKVTETRDGLWDDEYFENAVDIYYSGMNRSPTNPQLSKKYLITTIDNQLPIVMQVKTGWACQHIEFFGIDGLFQSMVSTAWEDLAEIKRYTVNDLDRKVIKNTYGDFNGYSKLKGRR